MILSLPCATMRRRALPLAVTMVLIFVLAFCVPPCVRGDSPAPEILTITPSNVTVREGTPLSMVYQFYNPDQSPTYPYTFNVAVAPIPAMDFDGPDGAAAGEFAELAAFPGYEATLGNGQYGQFTLNFTTTGIDKGNSASWQFAMPQISYTSDAWFAQPFGTPTVTVYETPEPSTLALLAAGAIGLAGYAWRRRRRRNLLSGDSAFFVHD